MLNHFSPVQLFVTLWTVTCQAPLSMDSPGKNAGVGCHIFLQGIERLLLNHANTQGFSAPGGEEFNPGPETRLDRSELLCNEVLLKYRDRESF